MTSVAAPTPTPVPTPASARRDRYVADLLRTSDRISVQGLLDHVDPLYVARRPDGLTVMSVRHSELPERYRLMIYAFRLAQYLRFRFACDRIVHERALFSEPLRAGHGEEIHVLGIDGASGAIVRYVSVVGTTDPTPLPVEDPRRALFPAELAHGVNLFDHIPTAEPVRSDEVWEIKRLMQGGPELHLSGVERMRLSLELMLGFYSTLTVLDPAPRYFVGDGEEGLAIKRLQRSLRDVTVLEGTTPRLSDDDLFAPLYVTRSVVKPFLARAPRDEELAGLIGWLGRAVDDPDPLGGFRQLVGTVASVLNRVHLDPERVPA